MEWIRTAAEQQEGGAEYLLRAICIHVIKLPKQTLQIDGFHDMYIAQSRDQDFFEE